MKGSSVNVTMRRFALVRDEDVSGTSGTGIVAEGVELSNGQAVLHWLTQLDSVATYTNMKVLEQVHGHGGKTRIQWIDEPNFWKSVRELAGMREHEDNCRCERCKTHA